MSELQEILNKLNKKQKEAVFTTEGPVLVVAGPGTGKTQIIASRAAYICKQAKISPENILITTFTESGVKAIKDRLIKIMGSDGYRVHVNTLHGFASSVISDNYEYFSFQGEMRAISDIEKFEIIESIMKSLKLKKLHSFFRQEDYIAEISQKIADLKREDKSPDDLKRCIDEWEKEYDAKKEFNPKTGKLKVKFVDEGKHIEKSKEFLKIYEKYQERLKKDNLYDYEDMIVFVVNKFKEEEDLLAKYQEQYLYIMLDEYQDTNTSQNEIIELLTGYKFNENPNVFVVGDDDQSIYRFQGASLENILFFSERFNVKKPIVLEENYRSEQSILDAAFSLIKHNQNRIENFLDIKKKIKAVKDNKKKNVHVCSFLDEDQEKEFILNKINELKNLTSLKNIAIFCRKNKECHEIAKFLESRGIPVLLDSSDKIWEQDIIKIIILYLSVIQNPMDTKELSKLLALSFLDIDLLDLYKILHYFAEQKQREKNPKQLFEIISNQIDDFSLNKKEKIIEFLQKLDYFKRLSSEKTFLEFFEIFLKESGILKFVFQKENKYEDLRHISTLFSEIKKMSQYTPKFDIEDFLKKVSLYQRFNISVKESPVFSGENGVCVMTAHRSKGLEFDYVFIYKTVDKSWGNKRDNQKVKLPPNLLETSNKLNIDKNEDERRLFFVALTRAKNEAFVTCADYYLEGGMLKQKSPSQFIYEIDSKFLNFIDGKEFFKDILKVEDITLKKFDFINHTKDIKKDVQEFLRSILDGYKLNISNINNYLRCPRMFFFKNILRIPEAKSPNAAFGSAIHKALESFFTEFKKEGVLPTKEFLVAKYSLALKNEILTYADFERLLEKGKEDLSDYYENYKDDIKIPLFVEYSFSTHNIFLDDIPLSGRIDKVELLKGNDVKVIDYKTGSAPSKNKILDKDSEYYDLKRQIIFYKLLTELDSKFSYNMALGELDFVIKDGYGRFRKIELEVLPDDLKELKDLIKDVYYDIMALKFDCKDSKGVCKYCADYIL